MFYEYMWINITKNSLDSQPLSKKEKVMEKQKDKVIPWPHLFEGVMYFKWTLLNT